MVENNLFFEETSRKIEFLRGISRKSRDFGREKTKHGPKKLSASELFGPCFVFSLPTIEIFREILSKNEIFRDNFSKEHVIGN